MADISIATIRSPVGIRSAASRLIYSVKVISFALIFFFFIACSQKTADGSEGKENSVASTQQSTAVDRSSEEEAVKSFVEETATDRLQHSGGQTAAAITAVITEEQVAAFFEENYTEYFQKYALSCEAAVIRLATAALGVEDQDEDRILELMPTHPVNPDIGFVVADLNGSIDNPDGTINWRNYGAHPPVVASTIDRILYDSGLSLLYRTETSNLYNQELRSFLDDEPACLAAIIWVAAYVEEDQKPPMNLQGQVYGEHVQIVSPILDEDGKMVVYDVWPWGEQPFHLWNPLNRDLFGYQTVLIMAEGS